MKTRLKSIVLTGVFGFGLTLCFAQLFNKKGGEPEEFVNKVAEYKAKSREKIKPHRYDGSKITHFAYTTYEQKKSVEVLLFNGIDYKFCFNTDGVPKSIDVKIYNNDGAAEIKGQEEKRVLLFEAKGVMQKDVLVTSDEMLKKLLESKKGVSLKKIFIEYHVPMGDKAAAPPAEEGKKGDATSNPQEKGVVVVSYGYKNV